jgi:flagellar protein FliO/FliZ
MTIRDPVPASTMFLCAALAPAVARAADPEPVAMSWWSLVAPLLLVLGVGAALLWLVKRRFSGALFPSGPLRVVQVVPVGPRERLLLLDHDGRRLLCGITAHAISVTELGASGRSEPASGDRLTSP